MHLTLPWRTNVGTAWLGLRLILASVSTLSGLTAHAHISGPQLLVGNAGPPVVTNQVFVPGDTLTYTISSDILFEFAPTRYHLSAFSFSSIIDIEPSAPFDQYPHGTWTILCLSPGTQTVMFGWTYTHPDNSTSSGTFPVTIIVHPYGTDKKSSANYPHAAKDNDPVNLYTGELTMEETPDLNLGGPLPLRFQRYHASGLARDTLVQSRLGPNWSHNYDWRALRVSNLVDVVTAQGRRIRFQRVGGAWQLADRPAITPFQLVDSGANLILGDPRDQRLYTFNTNGLLIAIADGRGNTHTLTYNGSLLQQVADGLGRTLTFTNTGFAQLTAVSDGQRNVRFGYLPLASRPYLTSVTNALGNVTTYDYDLSSSIAALLTAKTRPLGNIPFAQSYDSAGRVTNQIDGGIYETPFFYNGNVSSFTDPRGNTRSYTHSTNGALVSYTDEAGLTLGLNQNANGQRSVVTDRLGDRTGIAYHAPSGKPSVITNADGTLTSFLYTNHTAAGMTFYEPAQVTYPDGTTARFTYDASGNVLTRTDRAGKVWTFTYNPRGQVLTALNPTGGTTTYTYDARGNLASRRDSDTSATTYAYDQFSRRTNAVHPDSTPMRMAWDANDRLTATTDERGNATTFAYNANDNLLRVTDALGRTSGFAYDARDRMIRSTNSLGQVSARSFGPLDQILAVTNRNGNVTTFSYDARRRQTAVTDPGGRTWSTGYDNEDIPIAFTNPLNQTSRTGTDKLGYPVIATNALGHVTRVVRDPLRRVTATVDGINRTNGFSYDARGLLASATKPVIGTANYQRNNLGRLAGITDLNGSQWNFSHTAMGREAGRSDPLNRAQSMTYDSRGRPLRTAFPDGVTCTNTYDGANNLTRRRYSDGTDYQFTYDALNRPVSANGLAFAYDAAGRLTNTASSGVNYAATYDPGGRLTSVRYHNGTFTVNYTYDSRDRLTRVADTLTGTQIDFTYDDAGRRTGVTRPNGVNGTYTYDAAGRVTRIREGVIIDLQFTFDAARQITSVNHTAPLNPAGLFPPQAQTHSFDAAHQISSSGHGYDARGRQTTSPGHSFQWDGASRLKQIDSVTLAYDGANNLQTRTAGGVTIRYFYNHAIGLAPIMAERNEAAGTMQRYYVWTPGGRLLYAIDPANGNAVSHYHFDQVGSTLALTAANGSVTDAYAYTPYGVLLGHTGPSTQPFTYVGRYGVRAEPAANLSQMRARYYEAASARFLSRDPRWPRISSPLSLNPYEYAAREPGRFIDPKGGESVTPDAGEDFADIFNAFFGRTPTSGSGEERREAGARRSKEAAESLAQPTQRAKPAELSAPGPDFGPASTGAEPMFDWVKLHQEQFDELVNLGPFGLIFPSVLHDFIEMWDGVIRDLERSGSSGPSSSGSAGPVGFDAGIDDLFDQLGPPR